MRNFTLGALLVALIAFAGFYFYKQNHVTIEKPTLPRRTDWRGWERSRPSPYSRKHSVNVPPHLATLRSGL